MARLYNRGMSERPTRIVVELDAIAHNLRAIRARVGVPVLGIVKANAYGHGLVPVARRLEAQCVDQLGVAFLEEVITLREAGVDIPILMLVDLYGPQSGEYLALHLELHVSPLAQTPQDAAYWSKARS